MMKYRRPLSQDNYIAILFFVSWFVFFFWIRKIDRIAGIYQYPPLVFLDLVCIFYFMEFAARSYGISYEASLPEFLQFTQFSVNKKIVAISLLLLLTSGYMRLIDYFLLGV